MPIYKVTYYVNGRKKSRIVEAKNKKDAYFKVGVEECIIKEVKKWKNYGWLY